MTMTLTCLVGVVLVSQLWDAFGDSDNASKESLGIAAALVFAIANALSVIIVNTRLRDESPLSMTCLAMASTMIISFAALVFDPESKFAWKGIPASRALLALDFALIGTFLDPTPALTQSTAHSAYLTTAHPATEWVCLSLVGLLMAGQQGCRNFGFAMARDSTVVTVLYFEIIFSFIWTITVLHENTAIVEYVGAAFIIVGSSSAIIIKARTAAATDASEIINDQDAELGMPTQPTDGLVPEAPQGTRGTATSSNNPFSAETHLQ